MNCPVCNGATRVTWSGSCITWMRRRRRCLSCNYRFNTCEVSGILLRDIKKLADKTKRDENGHVLVSMRESDTLFALLDKLPEVITENDKIPED